MKSFSKFQKVLVGLSAFTGAATVYYFNITNKKVHASWTTNYEPPFASKWDNNWDHRSPTSLINPNQSKTARDENELNEEIEKVQSKAVRHVILIRHGQYNLEGNADEERFLTKLGRIQAEYTGKRLKDLSLPYSNLVISTMCRAQETGSIIASSLPDVPIAHCDLLREGAPIPPEPPLRTYKQELHYYADGARIEAAFRKYFHRASPRQKDDSYTVLVCHANVIRYFVCRALQFPAEGWLRISLNHASITWISITPSGRVILRCLGDSGHMPVESVTSR